MVEKISLMDVYLIEHLKNAGISDNEIIKEVQALNADTYQYVNDSFDFTRLHDLSDQIEKILEEGYQVKFLTFTGLVNLLRIKFKKEETADYDVNEFVVSKLSLTASELMELRQIVSPNWEIRKENEGVRIKPIQSM